MSNDVLKMMEQDFEDTIASSVEKIDQKGLTTVADKSAMKSFTLMTLKQTSRPPRKGSLN
jgi:hypothetical protein